MQAWRLTFLMEKQDKNYEWRRTEGRPLCTHLILKAGADLGFYKGGCPIHLKGAPLPPNYFDPRYLNQTILALEEIVGARRSYDI